MICQPFFGGCPFGLQAWPSMVQASVPLFYCPPKKWDNCPSKSTAMFSNGLAIKAVVGSPSLAIYLYMDVVFNHAHETR